MWTKINRGVFQIHSPFTTGTNAFRQACERRVVTKFFTALCIRQLLGQLLFFKVTVQGNYGLPADQHCDEYADDVTHIATVAGQIGNQFNKKREERKQNEAPDKRPISAFPFFHKQPSRRHQQRQGQRQAVQKHAQLLSTDGSF